ncbi:hypothetical protein Trco_004615 [Trichoderma cornu-damae]|uniref:Uncharacterized protein n=1 Tax=Trichoderma cornu-damae TaxID=654480 RepID=A0A9P8TXP8_9HYPO|nr:hypothetical protein Trco_004615 [Trichoderma cornu-damae]
MVYENITEDISEFFETYPPQYSDSDGYFLLTDSNTDMFFNIVDSLLTTMENSVFQTFEVDLEGEFVKESREGGCKEESQSNSEFNTQVNDKTWSRYNLIWPMIRTIIYLLLALAMGLVALLNLNEEKLESYLNTPWLLPTLCIVWALVLLHTRIHHDAPLFFSKHSPMPLRRGSREAKSSD